VSDIQTVPPDWIADIRSAIEHPEQFKYAGWPRPGDPHLASKREFDRIIPAVLIDQYDRFHSRAMIHSKTKGEHEAAGLLNFFIVWKFKLWRAEYENWGDYVRDVTNMPHAISATSLHQGVGTINTFIEKGMTVDHVIGVMGLVPTAGMLLKNVDVSQLPGGDINSAAEMIIELGPGEAIAAVNDWTGKATYTGLSAIHDKSQERLYLEVRRSRVDGAWDRMDWMIQSIDAEAANWFMERCGIRGSKRVFK